MARLVGVGRTRGSARAGEPVTALTQQRVRTHPDPPATRAGDRKPRRPPRPVQAITPSTTLVRTGGHGSQRIHHHQLHRHVRLVQALTAFESGVIQALGHVRLQAAAVQADSGFGAFAHTVRVGLQRIFHHTGQVVAGVVKALLVGFFERAQLTQGHGGHGGRRAGSGQHQEGGAENKGRGEREEFWVHGE